MSKDLSKKLEAILFVSGEPLSIARMSKILKKDKKEIQEALDILREELSGRGIRLSQKVGAYVLLTAPELSGTVQDFMKEELGEELSRAALETLSVIVYRGPLSRAKIDFIRGVNSSFTVRNLMIRGLIERRPDPDDSRSWLYEPSFEFLKFAGIERLSDLEGYEEFKRETEGLLSRVNKEEEEV